MRKGQISYKRHRFPPVIINHAVWLYHRFCLGFLDVEDLLAERGLKVSYETIRQWCRKFGSEWAGRLRKKTGCHGDYWYIDEVFVNIRGKRHYLWRAVDQDGGSIDIPVQSRRDSRAAKRFFRKLLKGEGQQPNLLDREKLGSYGVAHRDLMPGVTHETKHWANDRAEVSQEAIRHRERQMRGFESPGPAQRFLSAHGIIGNLFRLCRQKARASFFRVLRTEAYATWRGFTVAARGEGIGHFSFLRST